MKVLVTGASGFLGSYLVPALLQRGAEVVVFDLAENPLTLAPVMDRLTYIRGNLGDEAALRDTMRSHCITDVIHLGALLARPCEENPALGFRVNFDATRILLEESASQNIRRFVFVSSIAVFGKDANEPVADEAPKNPATVYGQTKLAGEHLLRWYAQNKGLDARGLRFTWVFGPGRVNGITAMYSSLLLDKIARGEPVDVPNPDERGDWLYVKDAVKALLDLMEAPAAPQRVYNIAGGSHAIRDVLAIAKKIRPDATLNLAEQSAAASPYPSAYDDAPARREWGWSPDYPIERAVAEHLDIVAAQAKTP